MPPQLENHFMTLRLQCFKLINRPKISLLWLLIFSLVFDLGHHNSYPTNRRDRMALEKREITFPSKTWAIVDAISSSRCLSPSELLESLIVKLANFEQITYEFNSPVKAVTLGGDTIEGDSVGGNKIVGNMISVGNDVAGNVSQNYYCQQLIIQMPDARFRIFLDAENQLRLEPTDGSTKADSESVG